MAEFTDILEYSVYNNYHKSAKFALENGADPNEGYFMYDEVYAKGDWSPNLLHHAIYNKRNEMTQLLLKYGAHMGKGFLRYGNDAIEILIFLESVSDHKDFELIVNRSIWGIMDHIAEFGLDLNVFLQWDQTPIHEIWKMMFNYFPQGLSQFNNLLKIRN